MIVEGSSFDDCPISFADEVYICHTPYHVLISLLKMLTDDGGALADLLLVDTIPDFREMAQRIAAEGTFRNIILIEKNRCFVNTRSFHINAAYINLHQRRVRHSFSFLKSYGGVYIFNDYTEMGSILALLRIDYHLLEDGLDCYKLFDQHAVHGRAQALKWLLNKSFSVPMGMAEGKTCVDVEVNDKTQLMTDLMQPLKQIPRSALMESAKDSDKATIARVFDFQPVSIEEGSVIILTQPLREIGVCVSDIQQVNMYRAIADKFRTKTVFLKLHPRDRCDYSQCFQKERILSGSVPIEVILLAGGRFKFDAAVTYSSTAILALSNCKKRFVLDANFVSDEIELLVL